MQTTNKPLFIKKNKGEALTKMLSTSKVNFSQDYNCLLTAGVQTNALRKLQLPGDALDAPFKA